MPAWEDIRRLLTVEDIEDALPYTDLPEQRRKTLEKALEIGDMENSVLTPLQQQVLVALFDSGLAERGYYLTGGTALSAFYLQHRYSDDLDFFTRKRGLLEEDFRHCSAILESMGIVVASQDITAGLCKTFRLSWRPERHYAQT